MYACVSSFFKFVCTVCVFVFVCVCSPLTSHLFVGNLGGGGACRGGIFDI